MPFSKGEVSTTEAAVLLGCSVRTIERMIDRGSIHARVVDPQAKKKTYRRSRSDVEALARAQRQPTPPRPK